MENNKNKGIIYCRVSSHEQTKGTSLDNQQQACLDYAENKGIKIVKIFIEKGESATAADRTEFLKALEFCRENKDQISAFIVWKIDRFARNTTDHFAVRAKLVQYGTTLFSVTEPITQDPQGKLMETLLAGFAEFENEVRKQRCTGGLQSRLKTGIYPWRPPIGYVHSKKIKDRRKLNPDEPDEERFYLIQKGLKEYATGKYTITQLAETSNKWGLKTRTELKMRKQLWNKILEDKFYAGILTDPWNGDEYQGLHRPMITLEEYNKIQAVKKGLSNHATASRLRLHPDFPLRRFVSCSCGRNLTASWRTGRSKKYPYYHCNNKNCQHYGHNISKGELEDKFKNYLEEITPSEKFLRVFEASVIKKWREDQITFKQENSHYERELKKLGDKKERLVQMRMNGEISKDEFTKLKDSLENQITTIQISKHETKIDELDVEVAVTYTVKFIRKLARQWQDMDTQKKQRLQKLVLPKGISYDKSTGNFGTAILSPIFKLNMDFQDDVSQIVAEVGLSWHRLMPTISQFYELGLTCEGSKC